MYEEIRKARQYWQYLTDEDLKQLYEDSQVKSEHVIKPYLGLTFNQWLIETARQTAWDVAHDC